jgi:hypothetical protein
MVHSRFGVIRWLDLLGDCRSPARPAKKLINPDRIVPKSRNVTATRSEKLQIFGE